MARTRPITVKELIAQLQCLPAGAFVATEGCDCVGLCSGAELQHDGIVLLLRDDNLRVPEDRDDAGS